jgi:hypothetical protein
MRGVLLTVAMAGLPALAWAQTNGAPTTTPPAAHSATHPARTRPVAHPLTIAPPTDAQTSGADTLAGETFSASSPPAASESAQAPPAPDPTPVIPTSESPPAVESQSAASEATPPPVVAPTGVAAPGINLSDTGAPQATAPARVATTPPAPHATPPSGVAAPGVNANASGAHAAPTRTAIEPANDLERAFVTAAHQASARAAFRRSFLASQVALATMSTAANAPAREIRLGPGGDACLIFTSNTRATQIMGANSPRQLMTGRQALERIRGAHLVIININMDPYLTLDAAGIEAFLAAEAAPTAPSAGPSQ